MNTSAQELGKILGKMSQTQSDLKNDAFGDDDEGLLDINVEESIVTDGYLSLNGYLYASDSFIPGHPVYGRLGDNEGGKVAGYNLDASDTTSAGGVVDQVGSNDGTATGFTFGLGAVSNGFPMKGWWVLDADALDDSGLGNNLTETSMSYSSGAAVFNGTTSRLQDASFDTSGRGQQTISVWVNPDSLASRRTIISYGASMAVSIETDGRVRVELRASSATNGCREIFSVGTVSTGVFTHILVIEAGYSATNQTRPESAVGIWINGVRQGVTSNTLPADTANSSVLNVGCYNAVSDFFSGSMKDLRIYAYRVTEDEITSLYNGGAVTSDQVLAPTWETIEGKVYRNIRGGSMSGDFYDITSGTASPTKIIFTPTSSFTIACRVRVRSNLNIQESSNTPFGIVQRSQRAYGIYGRFNSSTNLLSFVAGLRDNTTGTTAERGSSIMSVDDEHTIILRHDGAAKIVYVHFDGDAHAGTSSSAITGFNASDATSIGRRVLGGNETGGNYYIRDVRIWDRNITTDEVAAYHAEEFVSPQGLVAKYLMDENSGNTINDTYHLVEGPNSSFPVAWNFNGTSEYITTGNPAIDNSVLTLATWVDVPAATTGNRSMLSSGSSGSPILFQANSSQIAVWWWTSATNHFYNLSGETYPMRVVCTFDLASLTSKIYINGVLKDTKTSWSIAPTLQNITNAWVIGRRSSGDPRYFVGSLAGVSISDRAWSAEEVAEDYVGQTQLIIDGGYLQRDAEYFQTWPMTWNHAWGIPTGDSTFPLYEKQF